jgi:hypothetical protein
MKTKFHPATDTVNLTFDQTEQRLFQKAIRPLKAFLKGEALKDFDDTEIQDFQEGLFAIEVLSTGTSAKMTTDEMDLAFSFVCIASPYLSRDRASAVFFARVLLPLAQTCLCGLVFAPFYLPTAKKLFSSDPAPPEITRIYEKIRASTGPQMPLLPILEADRLRRHLVTMHCPSKSFKNLVSSLDVGTSLMRITLLILERVDLLDAPTKELRS